MRFSATHISGHGRGKPMGVPTLNLKPYDALDLGHGVYAVRVFLDEMESLNGVMHVGPRPTFREDDVSIEVHLLDEVGELDPEHVEVEVVERLRGVMEFESPEKLVEQIQQDVARARDILL